MNSAQCHQNWPRPLMSPSMYMGLLRNKGSLVGEDLIILRGPTLGSPYAAGSALFLNLRHIAVER